MHPVVRILMQTGVITYDEWQTWVSIGGLNPADYADLAAVIASTTAKTTLCNHLDALRYMARSNAVIMPAVLAHAGWVTALDSSTYAVTNPTMTTNTAPLGTASATSVDAGYEAYKAFDKSMATWCAKYGGVLANWACSYLFAGSYTAYKIATTVKSPHGGTTSFSYALETAPDGSTWSAAQSYTESFAAAETKTKIALLSTPVDFNTVRLRFVTVPAGSTLEIQELQIYGLDLA